MRGKENEPISGRISNEQSFELPETACKMQGVQQLDVYL